MSISRICVFLYLTLPAFAQTTPTANPFAGDKKAAEAGMATFRRHCSSCHGKQAEGGRAPDLTGRWVSDRDADLFHTISTGVPGAEMEAYGERLSPEDIWQIVTFLIVMVRLQSTIYTITNQRVMIERGMLSKSLNEIDLRYIDDTQFFQSFAGRLLGIGNVTLISSDKAFPTTVLQAIARPRDIREMIRARAYQISQRQLFTRAT